MIGGRMDMTTDYERLKQALYNNQKMDLADYSPDPPAGNWTIMQQAYQPYTTTTAIPSLGGMWGFGTAEQEAYNKAVGNAPKKTRTLKDVVAEEVDKLKNIK